MARYRITIEFEAQDYTEAYTEFSNIVKTSSLQSQWSFQQIPYKPYYIEGEESEHLARKDSIWTRLARRIVRAGSS